MYPASGKLQQNRGLHPSVVMTGHTSFEREHLEILNIPIQYLHDTYFLTPIINISNNHRYTAYLGC